jgi:serine/threonine protein kinase
MIAKRNGIDGSMDSLQKFWENAVRAVRQSCEVLVVGTKEMLAAAQVAGIDLNDAKALVIHENLTKFAATYKERAAAEKQAVTVPIDVGENTVLQIVAMPNGTIYLKGREIAKGHFKTVSVAIQIACPRWNAAGDEGRQAKVLSETTMPPNKPEQLVERSNEIALHRYLRKAKREHPGSLHHFGVGRGVVNPDTGHVAVITDYCNGGSLDKAIESRNPLSLKEKIRIASNIASGLRELHDLGVLHRDLKPDNFVMTKDEKGIVVGARLIDLGKASLTSTQQIDGQEHGPFTPIVMPFSYLAPECLEARELELRDERLMNPAADVYQLGISFYQLFANKSVDQLHFHHSKSDKEYYREMADFVLGKRGDDPGKWPGMDKIPKDVQDMMLRMLSDDPKERPTAATVEKFFENKNK